MSSEAPSLSGAEGSAQQPRLRWLREVWRSTLGKKILVAGTGVILAGYVILHSLGNLKALQGPNADGQASIDEYAHFLREVGGPAIPAQGVLWIFRAVLITALVVHVVGVSQLIARASWQAVLDEIARCTVLCANCHRIHHAEEGEMPDITAQIATAGFFRAS